MHGLRLSHAAQYARWFQCPTEDDVSDSRLRKGGRKGQLYVLDRSSKVLAAMRDEYHRLKRILATKTSASRTYQQQHLRHPVVQSPAAHSVEQALTAAAAAVARESLHSYAVLAIQEPRLLVTSEPNGHVLECNNEFFRWVAFRMDGQSPASKMHHLLRPGCVFEWEAAVSLALGFDGIQMENVLSYDGSEMASVVMIASKFRRAWARADSDATGAGQWQRSGDEESTLVQVLLFERRSTFNRSAPPPMTSRKLNGEVLRIIQYPDSMIAQLQPSASGIVQVPIDIAYSYRTNDTNPASDSDLEPQSEPSLCQTQKGFAVGSTFTGKLPDQHVVQPQASETDPMPASFVPLEPPEPELALLQYLASPHVATAISSGRQAPAPTVTQPFSMASPPASCDTSDVALAAGCVVTSDHSQPLDAFDHYVRLAPGLTQSDQSTRPQIAASAFAAMDVSLHPVYDSTSGFTFDAKGAAGTQAYGTTESLQRDLDSPQPGHPAAASFSHANTVLHTQHPMRATGASEEHHLSLAMVEPEALNDVVRPTSPTKRGSILPNVPNLPF
jgi:hypothetical protein